MKEKMLNKLGLKVVSLVLAFGIWMAIVNISNPIVAGQAYTIPVEIRNGEILEDAGLAYSIDGKDTVTVDYKVRTRDSSLVKGSDFSAYIDLKDYNDVTGAVPVTVEVNKEKESLLVDGEVTAKPLVVHVKTEAIQSKQFDLSVKTKGKLADDYNMGIITLSPDSIVAKGPESKIGLIASVGVEIDVDGGNADLAGDTRPVCYDANGKELKDLGDKVSIKPESIHYDVSVLKSKKLNLDFEVKGTVAPGYRFAGADCDVKTVSVFGTKSVLASVSTLSVTDDKLSVDGAVSDKVVHLNLNDYLPPGTTISEGTESEITVTLKVEPLITKAYTLNPADLTPKGSNPDYKYSFSRDSVEVTVRGLKEDLEALDEKKINAVLDVTGMGPGTHPGALTFDVGEGFEIVNYSAFEVTVTVAPEKQDESKETKEPSAAASETQETAAAAETSKKATE